MARNAADALEKDLARFNRKGPLVKVIEHAQFDSSGHLVREGKFDYMEREFHPYKMKVEGIEQDEEAYLETGRDARDQRLVITAAGGIARAMGSLGDGTGYLVDQHGRPINRTPQAPITPMPRRSKDW